MKKTILITGSTDGIGLEAAKLLAEQGHQILLHGRNPAKLEQAAQQIKQQFGDAELKSYIADLSVLSEVEKLARAIAEKYSQLDVVINNAGIFKTPEALTQDGLDIRFAVNTIAPYLLTKKLLPLMKSTGRVVNLSSAAQAPVDLKALLSAPSLPDNAAYAQSKLALTMWSAILGQTHKTDGPMIVSVNPGSLLASKMVKEAYGIAGGDISIGANILRDAALSDSFAEAHGLYFDNDSGKFAAPHPDALDTQKSEQVIQVIEQCLAR